MKSAAFEYARATSVDEVCDWLRTDGDDTKVIAGGQSLVPKPPANIKAYRMLPP